MDAKAAVVMLTAIRRTLFTVTRVMTATGPGVCLIRRGNRMVVFMTASMTVNPGGLKRRATTTASRQSAAKTELHQQAEK